MLKKLFKILLDPAPVVEEKKEPLPTVEHVQSEQRSQDAISQFKTLKNLEECVDFLRTLSSRKVAKSIIRDIDNIELLEKFLTHIGDAGVMAEAKKRLATLIEIKESTTAVRALRRLEKIVEEARLKSQSDTWYDAFGLFDEMKKEWETFSATAAETHEFSDLQKKYDVVCASFESRVAEQEIIHHNRMNWETLCRDIESLKVIAGEEQAVKNALEILIEKRNSYPALPEAFAKKFENRFTFAQQQLEADLEKHKSALVKKALILDELEGVVKKAENIASDVAILSLDLLRPLSQRFEADIKHAYDAEHSLRQRFTNAFETVKNRISEHLSAQEEEAAGRREKMKSLAEAAEAIAKQLVTQENVKQLVADMDTLVAEFNILHPNPSEPFAERFKDAEFRFKNARRTLYNYEDQERWASYACKTRLCDVVEAYFKQINDQSDFRDVASSLRTFRNDWKQLGPVPREKNEEIWTRFSTACDAIHAWLLPRFEEADKLKLANLEQKLAIIEQLKSLVDDAQTTMKEAQAQFDLLVEKFKAIGPVPEDQIKSIFDTYREVSKLFFAKRQAYFAAIKERIKDAQIRKNALIEKSVDLVNKTWQEGFQMVKELRTQWKECGFAGKDEDESLWKRFNEHIQAFYDLEKTNAKSNLSLKEDVCSKIETLANQKISEVNIKMTNEQLKDALETWKSTGPVPEEQTKEILARFKTAMDNVHALLKEAYEVANQEREANQKTKEELLEQLEIVLKSDETKQQMTDKIKSIQAKWNACGPTFRETEEVLRSQFKELCDDFFANRKAEFEKIRAQQIENLKRKTEICMKLENLADISSPDAKKETKVSIESLAQELLLAFSMNVMSNMPETREERIAQAIDLQQKWREIGPVPREETQAIFDRYRRAGDAIFGKRQDRRGKTNVTLDDEVKPAKKPSTVADSNDSQDATIPSMDKNVDDVIDESATE